MDVSRIKKNDLQAWLPMMDGVEVLCAHLGNSEYRALRKQALTIKFDPRSKAKVEELDDEKLIGLIAEKVVKDWRGITDGDQEFPCTPENIDYLVRECSEFRMLMMDAPLSMEKMLDAEKAETEKNSLATSAPALTSPA